MANDLISRSALIDELRTENQICITTTGHELTMNMVYSFINKQPTAYDVDKVVEEINGMEVVIPIDYISADNLKIINEVLRVVKDGAIERIRKGGVE